MEVENKLELAKFDLMDVIEAKTTTDEGMAYGLTCLIPVLQHDEFIGSQKPLLDCIPAFLTSRRGPSLSTESGPSASRGSNIFWASS